MQKRKINKILIANRGEVAIRIMQTCKEMSIKTIAVFSEADRNSMHVQYADEAFCIGPPPSGQSYLNIDKIIEVSHKANADAIHPGYGFLSENANFSKRCLKENIIFIGPSATAIKKMGNKIIARKTMIDSDVPVVPGTASAISDEKQALEAIHEIGLPVMIKASAGGGGKGMRLIEKESEIVSGLRAACSEAKTAFGDDSVYIEKYIVSPHHIEFQILGDSHGNIIHLNERECSVQRRHQKVIEETPSPLMTLALRKKMGEKAVVAAKAIDYVGAGTIEFLVDTHGNFYFLEMNTRLQVEHPVTEMTFGIDLVKQQILIAEGKKIAVGQQDISQKGHSIECRIYAEDPDNHFMPSPGTIQHLKEPTGIGIRVDSYVFKGYTIPMEYDPLIAKLAVWAPTRKEAINRMYRALNAYEITGVKTSIQFLKKIMQCPGFKQGKYDTHFISKNEKKLLEKSLSEKEEDLAIIAAFIYYNDDKPIENNNNIRDDFLSQYKWKNHGRYQNLLRFSFPD